MYKNYFFLNRFVVEVNSILKDSFLISAFSQEKDKLLLEIRKERETRFLEISVNPGFPYITLKDSYHRAKKNTIGFFAELLPAQIQQFEIADSDRILKIKLAAGILYFVIRGKYTNISFYSGDKLENFKNPPEDFIEGEFLKEMTSSHFIECFNLPYFILDEETDIWKELKIKYPIIGKEIISEVKTRLNEGSKDEIISTLTQIIREIIEGKPTVFLDKNNLQIYLGVSSFNIFPYTEEKFFNDLVSALNFFISKKFTYYLLNEKRKIIEKHLDKELSHFSSKMNKLKGTIERGSKEEEYQRIGNLLWINISIVHKGMNSIELEDIYNENKKVNIKLDENLSPKKNVDKYFDKAKNDRIRLEKSHQLFNTTLKAFNNLKRVEQKFLTARDPEEYNSIMKELNIKEESSKNHQDDIQNKFKHYLIEHRYNIYVGKNNTNNDLLTLKFAKQNDYWFHARSVPGSHVVLRVENSKDIIPKNILKKAASLAAFHSKAKTAGTVPVSYTFKKYVVKKKGMEPGKVALLREDTLLVKPEIPDKCEYVEKA
ncbi:MAG: NFACT RNA binding domain-containing protein [Ignavibacteriaceae bacterium]